jgi:AmmeMemoRadiSam system protein A
MAATPSTRLEPASRAALLRIAATSIDTGLAQVTRGLPDTRALPAELAELRASFVTLTIGSALRGCCGSLEPARSLVHDVWRNARVSAFRDPRFPPLTAGEWQRTALEVSVLTPCVPLQVTAEHELLEQLVPGRDGLVLAWRGTRATFLPKVWEQVRDPQEFLWRLKQKAGWAAEFWSAEIEVWRYETESMSAERPAELALQGAA